MASSPAARCPPATLAALVTLAATERPAPEQSRVETFRKRVLALHERGGEGQAIREVLLEEHSFNATRS